MRNSVRAAFLMVFIAWYTVERCFPLWRTVKNFQQNFCLLDFAGTEHLRNIVAQHQLLQLAKILLEKVRLWDGFLWKMCVKTK